jgi:flavorubredoxin
MLKIRDDVYLVGVINPTLRIFDIVMATEYGTTYNAYAVRGSEKTALIETVHADFFNIYLDNLKDAGISHVDYIVLNHTEPDHSGSLAALLEIFPDAKIVGTPAAKIYLKNIANRELDFIAVKDGDIISLGNKTLKFTVAPFLHWPDSMFTYLTEDKLLFSCDFLGAHFCGATMFSDTILKKDGYSAAFKYYYNGIFSPFAEYVIRGLDKIGGLAVDAVCPSHGPVLVGADIETAENLYREWSVPKPRGVKKVAVFYASAYGCTKTLAGEIAAGIKGAVDCEISVFNVNEDEQRCITNALAEADGLLFGSPTINKDAVAPVFGLLSHIDAINSKKRTASAFGSFGWSGEAVPNIIARLRGLGFKVAGDGFKSCFVPSEENKKDAYEFGRMFGEVLKG